MGQAELAGRLKDWAIIIVTTGQSNLTTGCIAAAHGRFTGIRQVPSM